MANMLITGASGGLGRRVVPILQEQGITVRALSRRSRLDADRVEWVVGDTVRGTGLAEAVRGVGTVLHLAGSGRGDDIGTKNLVRAASDAGVRHMVMISVVGADTMPIGYFRAKAAAEHTLIASGLPWTVVRAAQFHTFVDRAVRAMTATPVVFAPRAVRFEPVDDDEVAQRIAILALSRPRGRTPDLAGPEVLSADELVRLWLQAQRRHAVVLRPRIPGAIGRAYRDGQNLAEPAVERVGTRWADHVESRISS